MKATQSRTMTMIDDALEEVVKASGATPELLLSDEGMACVMRLVSDLFGGWHGCPVKRCRRARCCQGPDMICQLGGVSRSGASPEQIARVNARMKQIAERHLERRGVW